MNEYAGLRLAAQFTAPKTVVNTSDLLALLVEYDALRALAENKRRAKAKKAVNEEAALPAWLPLEAWEAFLAMRVKIKKPATDYAQKLLLKKLDGFRTSGLSAEAILNQSIENSWQDLYAPKQDLLRAYGSPQAPARQPRSTRAEQQAQANQDALSRLNNLPVFDPNVIDVEAAYVP